MLLQRTPSLCPWTIPLQPELEVAEEERQRAAKEDMREAREAAAARAAAKEEAARAEAAAHRKAQQDATDAEIERFRKAAEAQHVTSHSSDATAKHASHLLTLRQEHAHALLAPLGRMLVEGGLKSADIKAGCGKCGACSSLAAYEQDAPAVRAHAI